MLVPQSISGYFSAYRKVMHFRVGLEQDMLVNNLGTGTVAFHSSVLSGLDLNCFPKGGMADLYLSVFCKLRRVPMVAIARHDDWLIELPSPNTSLHQEFRSADERQTALLKAHEPWGYVPIREALDTVIHRTSDESVKNQLQRMIPILQDCLR